MAKSEITKKYATLYKLFLSLSIIFTFGPMVAFGVAGFIMGEPHQKLVLGATIIIALLLTGVNIIFKYHLRSILWIVLVGVYYCLSNIPTALLTLFLIIAITTILDEFVFTPLYRKYKQKYIVNKEIDKRA